MIFFRLDTIKYLGVNEVKCFSKGSSNNTCSYSSALYAQGFLKLEQTCEYNLKAMCAQEKSTLNLTGHILISAHPSAEYCLSGRVVVSLLQAFTPLLRPLTVFLLTFLCTVHTIWMPYIGKLMLVRLFCSRNGSDRYEIMFSKTLKSNFYVHRSKRILRIQPSSLAQAVRRDGCFHRLS